MPTNETLIAVPPNVEQAGQIRQFLLRLVEKLDIVFGYRGDDPYVPLSQLQSVQSSSATSLTILEQTVLKTITDLLSENSTITSQLVAAASESTAAAIDALKSPDTVPDADDSAPTLTTPPTQGELQAMQDQIADVASSLNDLLVALRATEIIAT